MRLNKVQKAIIEAAKTQWGITFTDIERIFDKMGRDYAGQYEIKCADFPRVVYWGGWSQDAVSELSELLQAGCLRIEPVPVSAYIIDGKTMSYPLLKARGNNTGTRWLPVCFVAGTVQG